jgi:hypothetical protein
VLRSFWQQIFGPGVLLVLVRLCIESKHLRRVLAGGQDFDSEQSKE